MKVYRLRRKSDGLFYHGKGIFAHGQGRIYTSKGHIKTSIKQSLFDFVTHLPNLEIITYEMTEEKTEDL